MNDHMMSKEAEDHVKKKIYDIPYAGQSPSQILDIWYPNEEQEVPYPVIIHFHGGGFAKGGHREDSFEPMLRGVDRGYVAVSVEYRKSGEARFPAMVYDAKAAIRFLKKNAEKYDLDPDRFALWGSSAGGWLASMAALTVGNPAFEDLEMGNGDVDAGVRAVIDWCGPCGGFLAMDCVYRGNGIGVPDHEEPDSPESIFMGAPIKQIPELVRMASPYIYVRKDMPYFFIIHGDRDAVVPVDQSIRFAQAIRKSAGEAKVKLHIERGAPHHGRVWWHQEWVADMCFDYLDQVVGVCGTE